MDAVTDFRSPAGLVADALTPLERAVIERECIELNPRMRGASAADILDMNADVDACLAWTETWHEAHPASGRPPWYGMAVLAAAMLAHRVPRVSEVDDLYARCSTEELR